MPRQFQQDEALRGLLDEVLLLAQQRNLGALQLLDLAHELEKVGLLRLADERLDEQMIRREALLKRLAYWAPDCVRLNESKNASKRAASAALGLPALAACTWYCRLPDSAKRATTYRPCGRPA